MPNLTERLGACYTGAVHDVLRMMGHERVALPHAIKPLDPTQKLAGPVWTVSGHIDRTKSRHETLLGWCTLLSKAPRGHVVVCQPDNHEVAMMGELSAQALAARGVLGHGVGESVEPVPASFPFQHIPPLLAEIASDPAFLPYQLEGINTQDAFSSSLSQQH